MRTEQLQYALETYGSPLYVFDLDLLQEEADRIKQNLNGQAGVCYAMKANPFLVKRMEEVMDRIEICSMGEFLICKELQVRPDKMLISGVMKKKEDLQEIVEYCQSEGTYTVESPTQFEYLREISDRKGIDLKVFLRLTSGNQFGMDEATWMELLEEDAVHLKIEGVHYFSGTQKKSLKVIEKELDYLDAFLKKVKESCHVEISEVEYGPGIPVPYFSGREEYGYTDEGIQELAQMIQAKHWNARVTFEMGRAFAAMCGYYLTTVEDIKHTDGVNYCIVDGGCHQMNYDGQIRGMYQPVMQVIPVHEEEQEEPWTICGSLCTANDILVKNVSLRPLKIGDGLIFERTGAYSMTEGMALFLSHELPGIVLYSKKDQWIKVRDNVPTYQWNMTKENN